MNLIVTIAIGSKEYAQMALNQALSIKMAEPKAATMLICCNDETDTAHLEMWDYVHVIPPFTESAYQKSFQLKTELLDIVREKLPDFEACIFLDADTLMLSGTNVDDWLKELKGQKFTMICNDVYSFNSKSRNREDYTFWCKPEEAREYFNYAKMSDGTNYPLVGNRFPMTNSSFIYFENERYGDVEQIFQIAKDVWADTDFKHEKYKGVKPDELCWNVALSMVRIPHQIPYYPIFFTCFNANFEEQYIRNWKAIGFAGNGRHHEAVIHLYKHNVDYYRQQFDIEPFIMPEVSLGIPIDPAPLLIEPLVKKTIFRRDEVINSGGGIFNPDAIKMDGVIYTIFRKEKNNDFYKVGHNQATAIPHLMVEYADGSCQHMEINVNNQPENIRVEDFRFVEYDKAPLISHTVIQNNLSKSMSANMGMARLDIGSTEFGEFWYDYHKITIPVQGKIEKNWVFFIEDRLMYCVYSLSPYIVFREIENTKKWKKLSLPDPQIKFFHPEQRICNSTRPVLIGDEYLMLFHTKEKGIFFQGAVIINKATKHITHYTPHSIPIKTWGEGFQKNLIYVSGLLYLPHNNRLRVYFGESDSHACYNEYLANDFMALVKQFPVEGIEKSENEKVLDFIKSFK